MNAAPESTRFSRDLLWNIGSLAIAGLCGIVLNYLISLVYGAAALGIFNQVFAFYLIFSQFAALGFHYSVLTHVAATDQEQERRTITSSALLVTSVVAGLFAALFGASAGVVGGLLGSEEVGTGILYAAPGVLFFALSKITLSCLNGLRRMRLYAVFFGGRFVLMILCFGACAAYGAERAVLPVILTAAELVTLLGTLWAVRLELFIPPPARLRYWANEHLRFGVRGFMSGMLSELNTRVDVLVLGYFVSDGLVGAYSFAAILAEGIMQLLVVLRNNYAPVLIRLWAHGERAALEATVRRARNRVYLGSLAVSVIAVLGYAVLVPLVSSDPAIAQSTPYFAVLIAGMLATSGYLPFQQLLLYAGRPGLHTILMLGIVGSNAVLNVLFIAAFGVIGSAVATSISFVIGVILFRALVRTTMNLSV